MMIHHNKGSSLVSTAKKRRILVGMLTVIGLLGMSSCTNSDTMSVQDSSSVSIRLALPPDPIWQWLKDSGKLATWEQEQNISVDARHPFDVLSSFFGGHTDIVVANSWDISIFTEQSDRTPIIIGKYATDYTILAVQRTSRAETLRDLAAGALSNRAKGEIAVANSTRSTLLWGLIAHELYELDFNIGSEHFNLVVVEPASIPDLVTRSDVSGCICTPNFSASYLSDAKLKILHDNKSASVIYADEVIKDPTALPVGHIFVADAKWYDHHKEAVSALLDLWDEGLDYWNQNKSQIIAKYPHMFSVESDEDIAWLTEYAQNHNWMPLTTKLNSEDWNTYSNIFKRMQAIHLLPKNAKIPKMEYDAHSNQLNKQEDSGRNGNGDYEKSNP